MAEDEFISLVESALERSAEARATGDDIALAPPPALVRLVESSDRLEIHALPGAIHVSDWLTVGLAAAIGVIAMGATVVACTAFGGSALLGAVAMIGWLAFFATVNQFIRVRSAAVLIADDGELSVARRGLLGWRTAVFQRAELAAIHVAISHLATSDESTAFDLVVTTRFTRPGRLANTVETFIRRNALIECRPREPLDWIAARLRREFGVPDSLRKLKPVMEQPRWPKALLTRLREQPLPLRCRCRNRPRRLVYASAVGTTCGGSAIPACALSAASRSDSTAGENALVKRARWEGS